MPLGLESGQAPNLFRVRVKMSFVVKVRVMIHAAKHSALLGKLRAHRILQADFEVEAWHNKIYAGLGLGLVF